MRQTPRLTLNALITFAFLLVLTSVVHAQSQTFVSARRGDDNNPCTLAKPCRTFTKAINVVQASGEVVAIDSGDYEPFTAGKSVSIHVAPGVHAGIATANGVAVFAGLNSTEAITLRGLTLNGMGAAGQGIRFNGGALHLEDCRIENFDGAAVNFITTVGQLFVKDTTIRHCIDGILITQNNAANKVTIEHCRFEKNSLSAVFASSNAKITVRDSVMSSNGTGVRVIVLNDKAEVNVENCLLTGNGIALSAERNGSLIRVANSTITNNENGVLAQVGAAILTRGDNTVEGNANNGVFTGSFQAK